MPPRRAPEPQLPPGLGGHVGPGTQRGQQRAQRAPLANKPHPYPLHLAKPFYVPPGRGRGATEGSGLLGHPGGSHTLCWCQVWGRVCFPPSQPSQGPSSLNGLGPVGVPVSVPHLPQLLPHRPALSLYGPASCPTPGQSHSGALAAQGRRAGTLQAPQNPASAAGAAWPSPVGP